MVNAGVLTAAQMSALGRGGAADHSPLPPTKLAMTSFASGMWCAAYDWKLGEGLTVQPGVRAFNILNMANFDAPGTLGSTRLSGIMNGEPGSVNNTIGTLGAPNSQGAYRIGTGTGVYAFGAPRQLEFALKFIF